ncbi:ribonuclease H1 small subunit, partial [Pleomassaria siparia CBS 279.74]
MLSLQPSSTLKKCTPNLLPARLNHNGPIHDTQRYFTPSQASDCKLSSKDTTCTASETSHVYFRGRHLHGTALPLPANYTGAVVSVTDKALPRISSQPEQDEHDHEDEDEGAEVKIMEQIGTFDQVMVWGHGGTVDLSQDVYGRGLGEWVGFAEGIHGDEDE